MTIRPAVARCETDDRSAGAGALLGGASRAAQERIEKAAADADQAEADASARGEAAAATSA